MGQAKQRGSFEQRKQEAEKRENAQRLLNAELMRRRESPKHTLLKLMLAAALAIGATN